MTSHCDWAGSGSPINLLTRGVRRVLGALLHICLDERMCAKRGAENDDPVRHCVLQLCRHLARFLRVGALLNCLGPVALMLQEARICGGHVFGGVFVVMCRCIGSRG